MKTLVNTNHFANKPKSAFTLMVESLYVANTTKIGNQGTLASVIGTCFASMSQTQHTWKRETFRDLLLHLEAQGCYGLLKDELFINALANMASFGNKLVREIGTWEKNSWVAENQMSSLIRHCFATYGVPEFLESVFFEESKIHMFWYVQLGRGESVLALRAFPVKFTKKMAHAFKNAKANYTLAQAIRWAQAKGYGASETMAETLAWSSLPEHFEAEAFWETVIVFFSRYEELHFGKVQEAIFYIREQIRADQNFSMKGRTWEALTRQSDAWHLAYHKRMEAQNRAEWAVSDINGLSKAVLNGNQLTHYELVELLTSEALYEEGEAMSHCVAEYEYDCIEGKSAIFSLRKRSGGTETILATLEVALYYRAVVQAKAQYNEPISAEAEEILFAWASKEKLDLDYEEYEAAGDQAQLPAPVAERVLASQGQGVVYNPPQNNYRATRNTDSNINWRYVFYLLILLAKTCAISRM